MTLLRWIGATLAALAAFAVADDAHAHTNVRNRTANTIYVAYAYDASSGAGCGYTDPCGDGGGYRILGWYTVAPGGTVKVNNNPHHNAKHQFYANDDVGHFWGGGGKTFKTIGSTSRPRTNFTLCQSTAPWYYDNTVFWAQSTSTCCGFWCSPVDKTIDFNP